MVALCRFGRSEQLAQQAGAEAEIGRLTIARRQAEGQRHLLGQSGRGPAFGGRRYPRPLSEATTNKAVALVRAAADLDATMDKHPATPSSVLPARELLADLLLELNQPAAALVEYRAMLSTDPNRFRSLLGEARAAKQTLVIPRPLTTPTGSLWR